VIVSRDRIVARVTTGIVACIALSGLGIGLGMAPAHGGDDERLTRAQYVKRATKQCEKLLDASNELRKAQAPGATGNRVAKFLHRAADGLDQLVDGFDALNPPAKLEADTDELVDVLAGYADGLDTLADRVRRGQTFRVALEKNGGLVARLNGIAERATGLVTRLGLTSCLLPT
jgi:hypothetical protein